jgi:cell division transport system permease protein
MATDKTKKKVSSKALGQQKKHRRQWMTFMRMIRYGVNNFTRNAWLTIAATAVMTITLFVIFSSLVARNVLLDTLSGLRNNLEMSIFLQTDTPTEDVESIKRDISELSSVERVSHVTPEQAREAFIEQNKTDADTLDALVESTNRFPWTINIKVSDINNTTQLSDYVTNNDLVKEHIDEERPPSFYGSKRQVIETIAGAANLAQQVGLILSAVFVVISMLIIFNTIRMAIFNRREEINMMKLIGAEKSFIRGPFIVEAIVYGFFAAILASAIGYGLLFLLPAEVHEYLMLQPTIDFLTFYAGFVLLGMIIAGAIIGIISSLLATRRYLRL